MLYYDRYFSKAILIFLTVLLASCAQPPIVPVDDQSVIRTKKTEHVTGSGDTLYSIAFLSGLDFKQLAAWNNISEPFIIKRGQKINLVKPELFKPSNDTLAVTRPLKVESTISRVEQPPLQTPTKAIPATPQTSASISKNPVTVFNHTWQWPISASNIVNYKHSSQNKGIDIISHHGVDVRASAAGKVVYAGNGLKGYGNLIIIKHSDTFLSAYAHNRSLNVKEGDFIAQGQKIAEVGNTDAKQAKLHFEIRKNGAPVSPLGLLPKKVG